MSSEAPPVGSEVVRKVAALARLRVPEEDLPAWTGQLGRILSYIGQLAEVRDRPAASEPPLDSTPARPDAPAPGHGREALEANAPALAHGYGSVPRVVGAGGSGS
jgi:aspartyl-tRNA(Asn)/glutamyl-tRNA(Gln) amidotransferase subunit C